VTGIEIKAVRYGARVAQGLIVDLMADLAARYGEADATPTAAVEFDPPDGGFFVAYVDGVPAGCGGWRSWQQSDQVAEIKRVYTVDAARGRGVARAIMATLEADAKAHGRRRVILETGTGQPEALAFYEAIGYQRIPDFGHYRDHDGVRSYGRDI
jgi:GNAT superfamily N-acetyltransferase